MDAAHQVNTTTATRASFTRTGDAVRAGARARSHRLSEATGWKLRGLLATAADSGSARALHPHGSCSARGRQCSLKLPERGNGEGGGGRGTAAFAAGGARASLAATTAATRAWASFA